MINIIMCEDNLKDRKRTEKVVKEFFKTKKLDYKIHSYSDYNEKFYTILISSLPFKIYLLDIETPSRSGIDIAREIRKKDLNSIILFLTAHEELGSIIMKDELMFLTFINKFDELEKKLPSALRTALKVMKKKQIIKFMEKNILYTIDVDNILYISKDSFERKTIIKTDYTEIKVSKSLLEIRKILDDRFIQTHRACYINIDRKVKVDLKNRIITFDNGDSINLLSDRYKKEVIK